ncbi:MAG: hypothetical protein KJO69_09755 [Gammaproteobacteria bacterium]|nr:hypothetical protein [Gammaproteobacteria bacterium]
MQDKRERYLSLMGIDTYQHRQPEETPADVMLAQTKITDEKTAQTKTMEVNQSSPKVEEHEQTQVLASEPVAEASVSENENAVVAESLLNGISYITSSPTNGLLVVLPSVSKQLAPEARQLMSKMLNSIQCQPSATGFAELGSTTEDAQISNTGVRCILFMDFQAGKRFIDLNGAQRVPGEDYCTLGDLPIVVSIHPQELVTTPDLKTVAWRDLKLVAQLLQN